MTPLWATGIPSANTQIRDETVSSQYLLINSKHIWEIFTVILHEKLQFWMCILLFSYISYRTRNKILVKLLALNNQLKFVFCNHMIIIESQYQCVYVDAKCKIIVVLSYFSYSIKYFRWKNLLKSQTLHHIVMSRFHMRNGLDDLDISLRTHFLHEIFLYLYYTLKIHVFLLFYYWKFYVLVF